MTPIDDEQSMHAAAAAAGTPALNGRIRVMVVDDHPLMRAGVISSLVRFGGVDVVAEAGNGEDAVETFLRLRPDVCVIDLQMPGMDGVETIAAIRAKCIGAQLVVLTISDGDARIAAAMKAGARAYVLKSAPAIELINAIRTVHGGNRALPSSLQRKLDFHYQQELPTERELDVLRLASFGRSNREIGQLLFIAETTVKSHVGSILRKLGAKDRTHAVAIALHRGFIRL